MNNQKVSILFWLKKSKTTRDGTAPLYARITIAGEEEPISLGIKIKPEYWDTDLKRDTEPCASARENNLKIAQADIDLDTHLKILRSQHEKITPLILKNAYLGLPLNFNGQVNTLEDLKIPSLIKAYEDFITKFKKLVKKKDRSDETLKHWNSAIKKIKSFLKFQYNTFDFELVNIHYSFAEKFFDYMTLELDRPISDVTAKGYVKKLKQILAGCDRLNKLVSWSEEMMQKHGWYAHFVPNDEDYPNAINYHTHGADKSFDHPDLQICFPIAPGIVQGIFSGIINQIKGGTRFIPGKKYGEIIAGGLSVEFIEATENGRNVLRIIFPDKNGLYDGEIFQNQFMTDATSKGKI